MWLKNSFSTGQKMISDLLKPGSRQKEAANFVNN